MVLDDLVAILEGNHPVVDGALAEGPIVAPAQTRAGDQRHPSLLERRAALPGAGVDVRALVLAEEPGEVGVEVFESCHGSRLRFGGYVPAVPDGIRVSVPGHSAGKRSGTYARYNRSRREAGRLGQAGGVRVSARAR